MQMTLLLAFGNPVNSTILRICKKCFRLFVFAFQLFFAVPFHICFDLNDSLQVGAGNFV